MSINLSVPQNEAVELKPRITVIGVGGAGGNAVNNMINAKLGGVDFVVANTDAQALTFSKTDRRIQLGTGLTQGLGAGSKPDIGRAAAEETIDEINEQIKGSHMVFIAAGMGGGTGTGAAPVIARAARDLGVLTVGVVTKPFQFEGMHRLRIADKGIEELEQYVDTLIIIPNQNLFRVANEKTTFADAFNMADDVLHSGVRGVTDLMVMPGLINLDFADVRSVMSEMGKAMMGTGEAEGERRALDAAEAAISNPLLDDSSMAGASSVLINITGGSDMTLFEVDEAANRIRSEVDEDAYIIFGSTFDDAMEGSTRVSVVATGIAAERSVRPAPAELAVPTEAVAAHPVEEDPAVEEPRIVSTLEATVAQVLAEAPEMHDGPVENPVEDPVDEPVMVVEAPEAEIEDEAAHDMLEVSAESDVEPEVAVDAPAPEVMREAMPAAMPSAGNEDAYIPAPPAAQSTREQTHVDAMAEAALVNGADDAAKTKGPSLFERVTGGAKNRVAMFGQSKTDEAPQPSPAVASEPAPKPAMRTSSRSGGGAQQALLEPTLGGLDPQERLQTSPSEDDLLDIPAFLRRQAN